MILYELSAAISNLKGIGPSYAKKLARLQVFSIGDLLKFFPRSYEDRSQKRDFASAFNDKTVNTRAKVLHHKYIGRGPKKTLKIYVADDSGQAVLVCFGRNFLAEKLRPGNEIYLYGFFSIRYGELQCTNFDFEYVGGKAKRFGKILPVYPLTEGLSQYNIRSIMERALNQFGRYIEDELPPVLIEHYGFPRKQEALRHIHFPTNHEEQSSARKRLVYDELFSYQLLVAKRALHKKRHKRPPLPKHSEVQERLRQSLPFSLSEDQEQVCEEIQSDLAGEYPMTRLLQGDVGSGKTLVAFLAAAYCIELGYQVVIMAPTELLAKQHADNAYSLLSPFGIEVAFLSGNVEDKMREPLLRALEKGEVDLLIGTHAVFSPDVVFHNLKLIVVDEQQRFGVLQRLRLTEKTDFPDLLLMTATPIPRTLALTVFGDMDVSTIHSMPEGRKPVITHLAKEGKEQKVYDFVRREIKKGHQAYFVYPLIEQSTKIALKDAESMFETLRTTIFPRYKLALIHSRLGEEEKREKMLAFKDGKIDILVSTSVVEVGVDVANATCMVVEHAERFGLSALHQLRGRVGRGKEQSYAFLIYAENLTDEGKQRIRTMLWEDDGFKIAEEDLKIRGSGNMTGKEQSGFMRFKIANIERDLETMMQARKDAFDLLEADPELRRQENRQLKNIISYREKESLAV